MTNHYQELDELMDLYQEVKQYVLANAADFASRNADEIIYSTPSLLLGLHTPSLLLGIGYSKAYKKGKKIKSPGDRTDYLSYEYDANGKLIRITDHGDSLKFFYCILERNGFQWAVPIYRYEDHYAAYPYYAKIAKWDDRGRVLNFAQINNAELWIEKYTYDLDDENTAVCEMWNYVPNLSHSSKDKLVSETGSPAQLWIYRLDLKDPKKLSGELIESYKRDVSAYRRTPPCLPPPQIAYKK